MHEPHSVDDLLNGKLTPQPVAVVEKADVSHETNGQSEQPERLNHLEQYQKDKADYLAAQNVENAPKDPENEPLDGKIDVKPAKTDSKDVNLTSKEETFSEYGEEVGEAAVEADDYGNEVQQKRMYTEEEVQRMIRDRLTRGKHAEMPQEQIPHQPTQQQAQQARAEGFEHDPNSSETWETQLEAFIDHKLERREHQAREKEWQATEMRKQADFQAKFTTGVGKYKDFAQVLQDKPVTNDIMQAVRGLKDPAGFLYAVAKQQPKELERIANIGDRLEQAAEIGRLEERMRKIRVAATAAPTPAQKIKSDYSSERKIESKPTIDQLIQSHAKSKMRR